MRPLKPRPENSNLQDRPRYGCQRAAPALERDLWGLRTVIVWNLLSRPSYLLLTRGDFAPKESPSPYHYLPFRRPTAGRQVPPQSYQGWPWIMAPARRLL